MSLQYKQEVYIRKATRQARFDQMSNGRFAASLLAFGVRATGASQADAEESLLIKLTEYVITALQSGRPLPAVEGVDLSAPATLSNGAAAIREHKVDDEAVTASAQSGQETSPDRAHEVMALTVRESLDVAEALANPPPPSPYLLEAAREYREFTSQ